MDVLGLATFPWEKDVYNNEGGILLRPDVSENSANNLIHEIGHVLGLWHVHHGVDEIPCGDPCHEKTPSMITGKLKLIKN